MERGDTELHILGIAGSLRSGSYNRMLLRAARDLAPQGINIEIARIDTIELYNEDVFEDGFPSAVADLRDRIRGSDAVLMATPEYNFSIPGVLKNVIDWVSRPPDQPFADKPVAIMGASRGRLGTARAQYHLRQVMTALDAKMLNKPEVFVSRAPEQFDVPGHLKDDATARFVEKLVVALAEWTHRLAAGSLESMSALQVRTN